MTIEDILKHDPFRVNKVRKQNIIKKKIKSLTFHHFKFCKEYKKIIVNLNIKIKKLKKVEDFPMIPVRLFKKFNLQSVKKDKIVKQLVSSGTSGQQVSKIFLDKKNASEQIKVLGSIMSKIIGKTRLPMLIIDQNPNLSDRSIFNARSAAIFGFSIFGKNHCFLLSKNGKIDYKSLNIFLEKYSNDKFFIFGFTSIIYEQLIKKISVKLI